MIREVKLNDAKSIVEIYNYYVRETVVSFEINELKEQEMEDRIKKITKSKFPFIVYEEDNKILGYAYAGKWRERAAYCSTLETSVYVDKDSKGKGIGKKLYKDLIGECKKINTHVLMGVISHPNKPSQKLHESLGFKQTGYFKEVAYKFNQFVDVEFWSLMLDEVN